MSRVTLPELARRIDANKTASEARFDKIEGQLQWIARLVIATMFSVVGSILAALIFQLVTK